MSSINDRISLLIDALAGGNKRAFAIASGLAPTVIENIVGSRQGNPSFDVLVKIVSSFANINLRWLILGDGDMFTDDTDQMPHKSQGHDMLLKILEERNSRIEELNRIIGKLQKEIEDSKGSGYMRVAEATNPASQYKKTKKTE